MHGFVYINQPSPLSNAILPPQPTAFSSFKAPPANGHRSRCTREGNAFWCVAGANAKPSALAKGGGGGKGHLSWWWVESLLKWVHSALS